MVIAKVREGLPAESKKAFEETLAQIKNGALLTGDCKFKWIDETLQGAISGKKQGVALSKFDKKATSKRLVKEEDRTGLIMELPPYHKPKWGALLRSILVQTREILWKAIKVIFIVSLVFWLLTYTSTGNPETTILYRFGRMIEPVTSIFGFTWQTFLAFVSSAISKEAALGVLSTLYVGGGSLFSATFGGSGTAANLSEVLATSITQAQALAFIFAVTFNVPCLMAISSTYQETRSLKWTLRIALYYFCAALVLAFLVYHIGMLIF
ncbi:Fe2+ transport system protein B [Lachnospiraceae bacterium PFB1-21]